MSIPNNKASYIPLHEAVIEEILITTLTLCIIITILTHSVIPFLEDVISEEIMTASSSMQEAMLHEDYRAAHEFKWQIQRSGQVLGSGLGLGLGLGVAPGFGLK